MHDHRHHHHHDHAADSANFRLAFFLNLGFAIFEVFGGLWTNSLAIFADAVHDLGDALAIGSAWYLERISHRPGDSRYSFGHRRFSLLGALITATVLIMGSLFVLSEAIPRLIRPEPSHAPGMLLFAIIGLVVNGIGVLRMRCTSGANAAMVTWHLLEDVLGWLAVLVVSLVLLVKEINVLDPILSVLITLYILSRVIQNLRATMKIFLQVVPSEIDLPRLEAEIREVPGVVGTHHTHAWSLDNENHVFTTHVVVDHDATPERIREIKSRIQCLLQDRGLDHATVEIEFSDQPCGITVQRCIEI
jgi:cobalt-zinc-cadmium efflux system protein